MPATWDDSTDEILAADQVVALAYVTPARGVVLMPVTNFAVRDRAAGTWTPNTSAGPWKKLDRIRRNPHVAVAFHTRDLSTSERSDYVLIQGRATLLPPNPNYAQSIREQWEHATGPLDEGAFWKRWMRVYYLRVGIEIEAERVVAWPDLDCRGAPTVHGAPLPAAEPPPQRPPRGGTEPRLNHRRAAKRAARLPHRLLGWVGADGFPVVVPVEIAGTQEGGIVLDPPPGLVPPGGRRAGLTAHWFARYAVGQNQRIHTGWLEAGDGEDRVIYAPHTQAAYRMPASRTVFRLVAGAATRWRYRSAPPELKAG